MVPIKGRQSGGELDAACVVYGAYVGDVAIPGRTSIEARLPSRPSLAPGARLTRLIASALWSCRPPRALSLLADAAPIEQMTK